MDRRQFIASGLAGAAVVGAVTEKAQAATHSFKLKYGPHFGMFKEHAGDDLVDQINFMADEGFTALEDNGMNGRSVEDQERCAKAMQQRGITMGVFVASKSFSEPTFVTDKKDIREQLVKDMQDATEVAKRVNAQWCTVVCGTFDTGLQWDYQTANCIENLKYCSEVCEKTGLIMVIEPLNAWRDHPGLFLTKIPQAYLICRSVGSPSCKILFDIYHQQITEGNLIPNMQRAWDEIAYVQVGDNPGRKEPTTGEINFKNIFKHLHSREFEGVVGMEHGNSQKGKEGERAVIDAYKYSDDF